MPLTSYVGAADSRAQGAEFVLGKWAEHNGCDPTPTVEEALPSVFESGFDHREVRTEGRTPFSHQSRASMLDST